MISNSQIVVNEVDLRPVTDSVRTKAMKRAMRYKYDRRCLDAMMSAKTRYELMKAMDSGQARKEAIEIAEDLGYDAECLNALQTADTDFAIERILAGARKRFR